MTTIYALSTPEGRSAIAVFRLSGPASYSILQTLAGKGEYSPRQNYLRRLYYENELIDKAIVTYFRAPHSFTGEDAVEFHLHGSPALLKIFPRILKECGARLAEPGEFTKRAFYNGVLDLTEVEGLSQLIASETEAQHKVAIRQADGYAKKKFTEWRETLITQLALIEADIDFVEGELPHSFIDDVKEGIRKLICEVTTFITQHQGISSLQHGLTVALIGAPNVGKSTLYNLILGREAAIVSNEPGTTRDILETKIDFEGFPIILADMAGLRESNNSVEARGIENAKMWQSKADIKIYIYAYDQNLPNTYPDDADLILVNKADLTDCHVEKMLSVSFQNEKDFSKIRVALLGLLKKRQPHQEAIYYMKSYHEEALNTLLLHLKATLPQDQVELLAADLRSALHAIAKITGHIDVEDILGKIFSSFCIGK